MDNKESTFRLPVKGRYSLRAPESFPAASFGHTNAGAFSAQIDPTIVGPTNEGFNIRFTKVSAKSFKRGGVSVSQLGDYLRACGFRGRVTDEQGLADAVEQTANRVYEAILDWRAYNKNTKFSVEGMERFPSDGQGGHLPYYPDPTEFELDAEGNEVKDAEGNKVPKKLRANVVVSRYIPAS